MIQQIKYAGLNLTVTNNDEFSSILDISIAHKIPHVHECGGYGKCTTCRVRILEGHHNLSPKTAVEKAATLARKWDPSIRMACQTYPKGAVHLLRLIWSTGEVNQLQTELSPKGEVIEQPIVILAVGFPNFKEWSNRNRNIPKAKLLPKLFQLLRSPILMNNGIIYQYEGKDIIGIFGTTGGTAEKNCTDAIRTALGIQTILKQHFQNINLGQPFPLQSNIGIHYGSAFIGMLGNAPQAKFSILGDAINTTQELQKTAYENRVNILISNSAYQQCKQANIQWGKSFTTNFNGQKEASSLYEIVGFATMDLQLELQTSLPLLLENEDKFAEIFYKKVFRKAPQVKKLFGNNMLEQGRLFTHMLGGIVYSFSRPEHLTKGLKKLGESHQRYGVIAAHYPIAKAALLETIAEVLAIQNSRKTMNAWDIALELVMEAMMNWEDL